MNTGLSSYLNGRRDSSVLLQGRKGLDIVDEAIMAASTILGTSAERLNFHPDYLFIDSAGEKSIGVETASTISSKAALMPCKADKIVVVVDEADKMTEQCQNKLLKLIEESTNVIVILVAYSDTILPTIKSRVRIIPYGPMKRTEFYEFCNLNRVDDAELFYSITGGCPGLISEYPDALGYFKSVHKDLSSGRYPDMLNSLHLVKEKDPANFFLVYPDLIANLFSLIEEWICENTAKELSPYCSRVIFDVMSGYNKAIYTKDNFFYDIIKIIESLRTE